ncbi:MAG: flagellin [Geminicoccaceae bacterium]|nr:flagellin [Geminicoccaceae bacterium]MDW8371518.1 flagellin [Geminicoccaceae bacterium]
MPNSIVTNTAANTALRYLQMNSGSASSSVAKLSSGSRIVKASDDAASLAVGTKLKADIAALKQAQVNTTQATSLLQVADGGMARVADILQRMKALAVQASSGSLTNTERAYLNEEFTQLRTQIDDIAGQTRFNGQALLDGSNGKFIENVAVTMASGSASVRLAGNAAAGTYNLTYDGTDTFTLTDGTVTETYQTSWASGQVVFDGTLTFRNLGVSVSFQNMDITDGTVDIDFDVAGGTGLDFMVGTDSADTISVSLSDLTTTGLGLAGSTIDTATNASSASTALDTAIGLVNAARASAGALMSRFDAASANLATSIENIDAARSGLLDVDVAAEMAKFSSAQVLMQANVAMLAQANQMPQNLLRLLS